MGRSKRWAHNHFESVVKPYTGNECLIWPYATVKGYGVLRIDGKLEYVCRLICDGEPTPEAPNVLHSCGNGDKGCVAKAHLYYGSQKQNLADREAHGTVNHGTRNGSAALREEDVHEIRRLADAKAMRRADIGALFGVTRECVNEIAWRNNWAWLEEKA